MPSAIWSSIQNLLRSRTPLENVLHGLPIFAKLNSRQLQEVERIMHFRTYRSGEAVFAAGDTGVAVYIVLAGEVTILLPGDADEADIELARLGAGELFGELALLDSSPRSASAIARTPTEVAAIARPDWMNLIRRQPTIGVEMVVPLAQLLAARLRLANRLQSDAERANQEEAAQ